jgi:ABC-type transport system substrate-binding protein/serine/threonine protein kinase
MPTVLPLRDSDPERIGPYRLTGFIGEGGQGIVYLGVRDEPKVKDEAEVKDETADAEPVDDAEDVDDVEVPAEQPVAIKLLRAHLNRDPRARRHFAREFAATKRVVGPHTAAVLDADVEADVPYIVSEYVDGPSLLAAVRDGGPLAGVALERLAVGTMEALAAIHRAHLVHRDFKPGNVLLGADGPRVIDFGIARALDITASMTSGVIGTPAYMAPEQLAGGQITAVADIFAWGGTMVYAAGGAAAFGQDSIPAIMHRILNAPPDLGRVPAPLRNIVADALAKDPRVRPNAEQILQMLRTDRPVELQQPPQPQPQPQVGVLQPPPLPWEAQPGPTTPPPFHGAGATPAYQGAPPGYYGPPTTPSSVQGQTSPPTSKSGGGLMKRRPWVPVTAAAAGVALVAGVTVLAVNLAKSDEKDNGGQSTSATGFNAAITAVANKSDKRGGTLRLSMPSFDSLDPADGYYSATWQLDRLLYRPLMTFDNSQSAHGLPIPDLAAGPGQPSSDLKTWTYKLRPGVKFEDGTPVTSKDVKYAVARSFDRVTHPSGPSYFQTTLDAGSYEGPSKEKDLNQFKGVETPDDATVVFRLKEPNSEFDYLAAMPQTAPVPAAKDTGLSYQNRPVATGPYKVQQYTPSKSLTLVRNDSWTASSDPTRSQLPDQISVALGGDVNAVDNGLLSGQSDLSVESRGVTAATRARILADGSLKANADLGYSGFVPFFAISTKTKPLDNVHCRRAIEFAVDRTTLVAALGGTTAAEPLTSMLPPTIPGAKRSDRYPAGASGDVTKARDELKSCGKPNGFTTVIAARSDKPQDMALAQALQQSLRKAAISATIKSYPIKDYLKNVSSPGSVSKDGLGLMSLTWGPDYPTGLGFLAYLVDGRTLSSGSNGTNLSALNDATVNAKIDQIRRTADPAERERLANEINDQVMEQAAFLPVAVTKELYYRGTRAANLKLDRYFGGYDLSHIGVR